MPYNHMTVGDMRKAIEGMSDDCPLLLKPYDDDFSSCEASRRRVGNEVIRLAGKPARTWNYNTREVHNMYRANDDRYTQNSVLIIEIGNDSP